MREWFDKRQYEVGAFRTLVIAGGLFLQIGFVNPAPASEFANYFGGSATIGGEEVNQSKRLLSQ